MTTIRCLSLKMSAQTWTHTRVEITQLHGYIYLHGVACTHIIHNDKTEQKGVTDVVRKTLNQSKNIGGRTSEKGY